VPKKSNKAVSAALAAIGIDPKGIERQLQSPGLVGKTSAVALAMMAVFSVGIWRLGDHPWFAIAALGWASIIFLIYLALTFILGSKYPALTQLEGEHLLKFLMEAKATDSPTQSPKVIPVTSPVPDPANPSPAVADDDEPDR
jgi:hypothetical protein